MCIKMRFHYTFYEDDQNLKHWQWWRLQEWEAMERTFTASQNAHKVSNFGESWMSPSLQSQAYSSYVIVIVLLGIYPMELKMCAHIKTQAWMCVTALVIISETWKPPMSFRKWMNKSTLVHWGQGIWLHLNGKWAAEPWKDMEGF